MTGDESERGDWPFESVPEGWAWRPFTCVFANETTSDKKLAQKDYEESGKLSVIDQGQLEVAGFTNNIALQHPSPLPVIVFGDHTRCVKYVDIPFVQGADGVKVLRAKEGVDCRFAYHALRTMRLPDKGYSRHYKFLSASSFPVPPLPEQRRIVAKLESLQARSRRAREALEAVPALLEKLRQSILAAAFRGDLTADWRAQHPDVEPASELLKRIRIERRKKWEQAELAKLKAKGKKPTDDKWKEKYVEPEAVDDSELPELPEGWVWARAQDLASNDENAICAGPFGTIFKAKDFRAEGIPIVFLRHVSPGKYLTRKPGFMDRKKWQELFLPYSVYGGELLVTKLGDPPGACAIYPNDIGPAMVTPDVIKMEPDKRLAVATYLMHYLNSDFARRMTFGMSFGTTRLRMTLDIFRDMPVPLAPILEQTELVERVTSEFGRIATTSGSLDSSICEVGRFEQAILYKAFRGELVPQDPNDAIESPPGAPTPGSFATKTKETAKSRRNS